MSSRKAELEKILHGAHVPARSFYSFISKKACVPPARVRICPDRFQRAMEVYLTLRMPFEGRRDLTLI